MFMTLGQRFLRYETKKIIKEKNGKMDYIKF